MDILSSQANLAGYKAVVELSKFMKSNSDDMTSGTSAAKVLVVGAGLQDCKL